MVWDQANITSLSELQYNSADDRVIQAKLEDGVWITIEQDIDPILHAKCIAGDFGEIAAYSGIVESLEPQVNGTRQVEKAKLKAALLTKGWLDAVTELVAQSDEIIKIVWADQYFITREGLTMSYIVDNLLIDGQAITNEQMDEVFDLADSFNL